MVPAAIAVTKPVVLTVAIAVLEETQGLFALAVAEPVNCAVPPAQANKVPEMVGKGFIVNVSESVVVPHSLVTAKVTVCAPGNAKLTAPGEALVEVAGLPPEKLQA